MQINKIQSPQIFQGPFLPHQTRPRIVKLCPPYAVYLSLNEIPHSSTIFLEYWKRSTRKENSCWGKKKRDLIRKNVAVFSTFKFPNINGIPFHRHFLQKIWRKKSHQLRLDLGPTHWNPKTVHFKPLFTSVFKSLTWIFATSTKICTTGRSTSVYTHRFETLKLKRPARLPTQTRLFAFDWA